jgi:pimeloyl-ACP methyl ester carboxylesterase
MLGCGGAPTVTDREPYSLEIEAARIVEHIDAAFGADAQFHLVGHSFGGVIALEIARRHALRVRTASV